MNINETMKLVHENAKAKGFFEKEKNIGEMLALIHSEVSEALEADRNNSYVETRVTVSDIANEKDDWQFNTWYKNLIKGTFEEEMADIVIRVMDMCAFKGIDLESNIKAKMRYNSTREKYHGKKY